MRLYAGSRIVGLGIAALLASAGMVAAEEVKFEAELSGAEQVPPVETSATGTADVTFDTETKVLSWSVEYSGLSGDATAAHFHGPAEPGETAGPVVPIEVEPSPLEGEAELTDEQAEDLAEGRWYVNIHTAQNPGGEIRGQVTKAE